MKYTLLLFFTLLFCISSFSQKKYFFDYMLEYDYQDNETSKTEKQYIFTNSQDNSYVLMVFEKDSLNFFLRFSDFNSAISANAYLDKKTFLKAEGTTFNCDFVSGYNKADLDDYFEFLNKADTLVDGGNYSHYILKLSNPKKVMKKDRWISHYIVEKNTSFHLPFFIEANAREEWKYEKNVPNGIFKEVFMEQSDNRFYIYKLKEFAKINKYVIIPKECDLTPKERNIIEIRQ